MKTLGETLREIEERAREDAVKFLSDDIAANAEVDVPRLVAALRYAAYPSRVGDKYPDHLRIAAILRGEG